jgi:hypothetical protein
MERHGSTNGEGFRGGMILESARRKKSSNKNTERLVKEALGVRT